MHESPRVVVIGAGAAGLSAAMYSAELGARSVTVIEQRFLAYASSGLSAGIFNRQTTEGDDRRLRMASVAVFDQLEARGLLRLRRCGYIRLARTAEQWEKAREAISERADGHTSLLSPEEVARLVPGIRVDDVAGGMFGALDGHLDGPELCRAFLEAGRSHGVEYRPGTRLLAARNQADSHVLATDTGALTCDVIINAAGGWLAEVGTILGCPVPIDNQRHQVGIVRVPSLAGGVMPVVQTYFPGSGHNCVYIRPEGEATFIAGLHSYEHHAPSENPDSYRRTVDPGYLEAVAEQLLDRFPGWQDATLTAGWTGLYPLSPDGQYIIGPHPGDGTVICVGGLGGVGLTVSPAVGRLAAAWAVLGKPDTFEDVAARFLPGRFAAEPAK